MFFWSELIPETLFQLAYPCFFSENVYVGGRDFTAFFAFLWQGTSQEQQENKEQHSIRQYSEYDLYSKAHSCLLKIYNELYNSLHYKLFQSSLVLFGHFESSITR